MVTAWRWPSARSIRVFAGKEVIVAYQRDGKPMENQTFRLVVPGDAHGGRSVNDLVSLTIN